jgi:phosphoesterase RecJ-like protein
MLNKIELSLLLKKPTSIIITTHHKPDGDAMGSSLGLQLILESLGHEVFFISPSDYPMYLNWLPGANNILLYSENIVLCQALILKAGLIFCLDFNHLKRINELGEFIGEQVIPKVMIDHHMDPQNFADFEFWDSGASSTCQLIYRFLKVFSLLYLINADAATCFYTGIMTDSGSFRFPRTSPELHQIAAELIEKGADNVDIQERVNGSQSLNRLQFLGYCISEKLVILPDFNTAYFYINKKELERFQIETGDTDGIVNYALSIDNIRLAVFFVERSEKIKISFRSKGSFPSNEMANKYFSGGGHLNASGGESTLNLDETIKKFLLILPEYRQLLVT